MSIDNTAQLTLFSLILMRMSGFVLMNPILGRNNIPARVKGGFIFILTMMVYSASMEEAVEIASTIEFGFLLIKEFAAGYVIGYVMHLFFFIVSFVLLFLFFVFGLYRLFFVFCRKDICSLCSRKFFRGLLKINKNI